MNGWKCALVNTNRGVEVIYDALPFGEPWYSHWEVLYDLYARRADEAFAKMFTRTRTR